VVKKEEASVKMKQRDKNLASYAGTAPATESWPNSIPWEEEKIFVNKEAVHIKWKTLILQFIKVLCPQIHTLLPQALPINFNLPMWGV